MSEIRFRSSVAARIFGPRAKVCAEASSPAVILFLCPSMCESAVSFLFLAWASRSIPFRTSSRLQNSLILPTIVPAKPVWRFNSSGGRVAVSVGALMFCCVVVGLLVESQGEARHYSSGDTILVHKLLSCLWQYLQRNCPMPYSPVQQCRPC